MQERALHKLSRLRVWMSERDMNVNGIIPMRRGRKEEGNLDSCETERPDNVWGKRMQVFSRSLSLTTSTFSRKE